MAHHEDPLGDLFWRDEILQIMYWFKGEGLGEEVTAEEMLRFLAADAPDIEPILNQLVIEGFLDDCGGGRYKLTEFGGKEGGRRFADAFDELTKPAHGECSADCVCHTEGPEFCTHSH